MPTINQLINNPRRPVVARNKVPAMAQCPQKRGVYARLHDDPKETELGPAQGCARPTDQRL
jgi:ribosomal protein S12